MAFMEYRRTYRLDSMVLYYFYLKRAACIVEGCMY